MRRRWRTRSILGTLCGMMLLSASLQAQNELLGRMAGDGLGAVEAERLRPGVAGDAILDVESGRLSAPDGLSWSFWLGYNRAPIRALWSADGKESSFGVVEQRIGGNLISSLALSEWLQMGIDVPVVFFQSGASLLPGVSTTNPVAVAGLGDIRLVPKVALMNTEAGDPLDMAVLIHATLPTAYPRQSYIGDGLPTLATELALSRDYGALRWAANVGPKIRFPSSFLGAVQGQEFGYRVGFGYDFQAALDIPLALDLSANGALTWGPTFLPTQSNPHEVLAGIQTEIGDLQYFVAAGAGVPGSGIGAPLFRAVGGVRYAPSCIDEDEDGLCGRADACPDDAEDVDGYLDSDGCPDLDNDGDGVFDSADKCPNEKEDVDGVEDADGCIDADNDGDGIVDISDRCPNVPGVKEEGGCPLQDRDKDGVADRLDQCPDVAGLSSLAGCPDSDADGITDAKDRCPMQAGVAVHRGCADSDNDGLADPDDKCPTEPETVNNFEDEDGCADVPPPVLKNVKVSGGRINLQGKVMFESAMSTLRSDSYPLLDEVATLLLSSPQIQRVRIEGHTDSSGRDEVNMELSIGRADAVRAYLVQKGVDANRLVAQGFGETQPIADNSTPEGREENRRVVFVIEGTSP